MTQNTSSVLYAVVVGTFQQIEIGAFEKAFINQLQNQYPEVVLVIASAPIPSSKNHPLDVETRKLMLEKEFPKTKITTFKKQILAQATSQALENAIAQAVGESVNCQLFVFKESNNLTQYELSYPFEWVELPEYASRIISDADRSQVAYRAGVFQTVRAQYPKVFPTVDVAIVSGDKVLLGRKPQQALFRFIGGFIDPEDDCFEDAAIREAEEETGLKLSQARYIGTAKIDDWRYREEVDKIITSFFVAEYEGGTPTAQDDIEELRWFDIASLTEQDFVEEHRVIFKLWEKKGF